MTDAAAAVAYNPFEPGFAENPYSQYRAMREHEPVHESLFGIWLLFRYDDVLRFLRDPSLSVEDGNAKPTMLDQMADEVLGADRDKEMGTRAMLNRDPPDHTRLRKLVSKAFTPRRIEALRPRVQELVDESLDRAAEAGRMELIGDYAFALPFAVISEMLGMPPTDSDKLRDWSGTLVRTLEPVADPAVMLAIREAGENMRALITDVIRWKRENLSDDMLSVLIAAEENGDMLSDEELLEQVMLLFIAGHETTVNLIGNGTLALLHNPGELERLRTDRSLDAGAVEEFLRYDAPVQMSRRVTLTDVEVGGRHLRLGFVQPRRGALGSHGRSTRYHAAQRQGAPVLRWRRPLLPRRCAGATRSAGCDRLIGPSLLDDRADGRTRMERPPELAGRGEAAAQRLHLAVMRSSACRSSSAA
jgi:cytochrome P450